MSNANFNSLSLAEKVMLSRANNADSIMHFYLKCIHDLTDESLIRVNEIENFIF